MRKLLTILFIFHFSFFISFAQNPDIKRTMHWYFGYGAGLDFSSGQAVADTSSSAYADEAFFTMSDTCGNLLFYGHNDTIFNKNHQMMENGDIVPPSIVVGNPAQIVCVPQPENDSLFYIFYTSDGFADNKLFYAIVNINNGLGKVIEKDIILLDTNVSEKVAATQHCNGRDYWIVGKRFEGTDTDWSGPTKLYTWLLSENGVSSVPVTSNIGKIFEELGSGYFKFSTDGQRAAEVNVSTSQIYYVDSSYIQFYDFDNCTGSFSKSIVISFPCTYGIAFSQDNTKLYAGTFSECLGAQIMDTLFLAQFDISNYDSVAIVSSKIILKSGTGFTADAIQLAPDGKIYVCDFDTSLHDAIQDFSEQKLGIINSPNLKGMACDYLSEHVNLNGRQHSAGITNFVDSYFSNLEYVSCEVGIQNNSSDDRIIFYPNPVNEFLTFHNSNSDIYTIKIYNSLGKLCLEKTISEQNTTFDVSSFYAGLYFIQISNNNHSFINLKFIKL